MPSHPYRWNFRPLPTESGIQRRNPGAMNTVDRIRHLTAEVDFSRQSPAAPDGICSPLEEFGPSCWNSVVALPETLPSFFVQEWWGMGKGSAFPRTRVIYKGNHRRIGE